MMEVNSKGQNRDKYGMINRMTCVVGAVAVWPNRWRFISNSGSSKTKYQEMTISANSGQILALENLQYEVNVTGIRIFLKVQPDTLASTHL